MAVSAWCMRGAIRRGALLALVTIGIATLQGCDAQFPGGPAAADDEPEGCRVSGRIVSTAWRDLGGGIERAIVSAWAQPETKQVTEFSGEGEEFKVYLLPGEYRLVCSAVGTRGATFE